MVMPRKKKHNGTFQYIWTQNRGFFLVSCPNSHDVQTATPKRMFSALQPLRCAVSSKKFYKHLPMHQSGRRRIQDSCWINQSKTSHHSAAKCDASQTHSNASLQLPCQLLLDSPIDINRGNVFLQLSPCSQLGHVVKYKTWHIPSPCSLPPPSNRISLLNIPA